MATPGQPPRGLTAAEVAAACDELRALVGACVRDSVWTAPGGGDALLLVLAGGLLAPKAFVQIVASGPTARICTTARRWPKNATLQNGRFPLADAALTDVRAIAGERIAVLRLRTASGDRQLIAELFGPRGLFVFTDGDGRVLSTSRPVLTATRRLAEGDVYAPPQRSPHSPAAGDAPTRFAPPILAAIDEHFTRRDLLSEAGERRERLAVTTRRAAAKARAKVDGITRQLADVGRTHGLRNQANLMLAYQHAVPRGAPSMRVPDPDRADAEIVIELDPARPVVVQAQALYEKARRLDDSRAVNAARLQQAQQELATAERDLAVAVDIEAQLAACTPDTPDLPARLAALPFPAERQRAEQSLPQPRSKPRGDTTKGENLRRFVSAEGYAIWIGRTNEQNDRLTMSIANGNDVWLHVGGGRAGAHVIVRLPKQKTASLETLLDAAALAVHFSKARDERRIDVVYTLKKHVRKPKGLPAGAVVPSRTKTLTVLRDEARLARLLASANPEAG